ncbi:MAG TPA: galactokinase family protein [Candidatus Methanofastidiosa archaeon]|nr:galactokinase family protein [Candidatus Methanofastidiosa archaeon]
MKRAVFSAPGRVDLSGGAADIFGFTTLSLAIDLRTRCVLEENQGKITFDVGEGPIDIDDARGERYDLLHNIVRRFKLKEGLSFSLSSDIPPSSGLGGSASFTVSAIRCLDKMLSLGLNDYEVAEHAQRIETLGMELKNGYQDQYCSTFGGCLFMDFRDKENREIWEEPYAVVERLEFDHSVVVAHTGTKHNSGEANSMVFDKYYEDDKATVNSILELDDLTRELRNAVIDDDYEMVCKIVDLNQEIIRRFKRSYPENEKLIDVALGSGADAAKVTGAGCGGSIAAICYDEDSARKVAEALGEVSNFVKVCTVDGGVRDEL